MEYSQEAWETPVEKHVLMVSQWACIREMKMAAALRERGWRVDSLSCRTPLMPEGFGVCMTAQYSRIAQAIAASGASIIHVHNEPDVLMRFADKSAKGRPVVYDCHDLEYHRYGFVTDDERFAFARADAIVHVGDAYRDFAYSLHPWTCPEAVVQSLPLRSWVPPFLKRRSGVVYQGGVNDASYRDYRKVDEAFADAGIPFALYTSIVSHGVEGYRDVRGLLDYHPLLKELTGYEFGMLGMDHPEPKWAIAYPNKLWEYAACGVIPLIVNAPAAAEVFGSGIVATSMPECIEKMRDYDTGAMRKDVLAHARYMDDEIQGVIDLYEGLLCTKSSTESTVVAPSKRTRRRSSAGARPSTHPQTST